jgi:UDP-N-acetylmuramate--alanine ligase
VMPLEARLHFVGIGGSGMSAIAEVLLRRGYQVSGCDLRESAVLRRLRDLGAQVWIGHSPDHLGDADVLVHSRAIAAQNDEIRAAHDRRLPVRHRAEMLGAVMRTGRGVAVVGTHGKTTTTAMLTRILIEAGFDPTALIGADVPELGSNARDGAGPWVIAEVDESDGSLLRVAPWAAVVTSLDVTDHRDFYATADQLTGTFEQFLQGVALEGFVVVCADHPRTRALAEGLGRPVITYGFDEAAVVRAEMRAIQGHTTRASLTIGGCPAGELALQVPGRHNVSNATGAIAAALQIGVPREVALEALAAFRGASRRFEVHGEAGGVLVVDDYAHNPVKVAAVLRAAREGWPRHRVIALFQPHRFSRTVTTHADYAHAFDAADDVVITDIYAADEHPQPGVTARLIVDAVAAHRPVHYRPAAEAALDLVETLASPGAIVLTLGAGDIWRAGDALLRRLAARAALPGETAAAESPTMGGAP